MPCSLSYLQGDQEFYVDLTLGHHFFKKTNKNLLDPECRFFRKYRRKKYPTSNLTMQGKHSCLFFFSFHREWNRVCSLMSYFSAQHCAERCPWSDTRFPCLQSLTLVDHPLFISLVPVVRAEFCFYFCKYKYRWVRFLGYIPRNTVTVLKAMDIFKIRYMLSDLPSKDGSSITSVWNYPYLHTYKISCFSFINLKKSEMVHQFVFPYF